MSFLTSEFLKDNRLPKFIADSKHLKSIPKISKAFKQIGLSNCSDDLAIKDFYKKEIATQCIYDMQNALVNMRQYMHPNNANHKFLQKIILELSDIDNLIRQEDDKISLKLNNDIADSTGKIIYKKDQSIFKVYNSIADSLIKLNIGYLSGYINSAKLEKLHSFKTFSSINAPKSSVKVVFSAEEKEGLWDIATMSMRGVQSCQSWDGQYRKNLIGSITDPFVGIIYTTNNTQEPNKLGTRMLRRCVVKLIFNNKTKEPAIFIERMYPSYCKNTTEEFVSFVKKRTNDKIKIFHEYCNSTQVMNDYYTPSAKQHKKLPSTYLSYRDIRIPLSSELPPNMMAKNIETVSKNFKTFVKSTCVKNKNIVFNDLKFKYHSDPDFIWLAEDFYEKYCSNILKEVKKNNFISSKEYNKKAHYTFILDQKIFKKDIILFVKRINNYYLTDKSFGKITTKVFLQSFLALHLQIKKEVKANLIKLITKPTKQLAD